MLPAGMVLNMNPNRPLGPAFMNAAQVQRNMSPRLVINNGPIRLTPQVIQGARPGGLNVTIIFFLNFIYTLLVQRFLTFAFTYFDSIRTFHCIQT
jgi:hypothetical protein